MQSKDYVFLLTSDYNHFAALYKRAISPVELGLSLERRCVRFRVSRPPPFFERAKTSCAQKRQNSSRESHFFVVSSGERVCVWLDGHDEFNVYLKERERHSMSFPKSRKAIHSRTSNFIP
mmetsp:Transcript_29282/g.67844  ORF Transcript_29282/g.67844 Transcript_29282/m.67844 type:complete len:120 (-) Transcript_29282:478-837(-)